MAEQPEVVPVVEHKETEPTISTVVGEEKSESRSESGSESRSESRSEKVNDSVPLSKFLEVKNENKRLAQDIETIKKSIDSGAPKTEVRDDIHSLAEKYDVNEEFIKEIVRSAKLEASKEIDSKIDSRFAPIEERSKLEKREVAFNEHFQKALERMPEYNGIVNKEVIKSFALNPNNSNKTFSQLIEEAYGHLVQGKKTFDNASPRVGKEDNLEVDSARAKKDPEYFKQIMSDPVLKKKYNDSLVNSLSSIL